MGGVWYLAPSSGTVRFEGTERTRTYPNTARQRRRSPNYVTHKVATPVFRNLHSFPAFFCSTYRECGL
jgi:hypothetical protein